MVVVDTSILSLFLRRERNLDNPYLDLFLDFFEKDQIVLLGIVYQEVLSGIRFEEQHERLVSILEGFPIILASIEDHLEASRFYNTCRTNGVQGSSFDYLICAMAVRREYKILTLDKDFENYATYLPISLINPA